MPEILYKYRSLDNWKFILDIFLCRRLYVAAFQSLNDPMEGRYFYFGDQVTQQFRNAILSRKSKLRICSFSRTERNTLMWSYYGGAHRGIAVGIESPSATRPRCLVRNVRYDNEVSIGHRYTPAQAEVAALDILSQKQLAWKHEQEVRVFSRRLFVPVRIREIVFGCLAEPADKLIIRELAKATLKGVPCRTISRGRLDAPIMTA